MWDLATCADGELNVVPVAFKDVTDDGKLIVGGVAAYVTEGAVVESFKAMVEKMFDGDVTAKGALIITAEKIIVTTPGAENKKVL